MLPRLASAAAKIYSQTGFKYIIIMARADRMQRNKYKMRSLIRAFHRKNEVSEPLRGPPLPEKLFQFSHELFEDLGPSERSAFPRTETGY